MKIIISAIVIALIGFVDATYLTAMHYLGESPACSAFACETVTNSKYSTFFGIPVALFGALYYLVVLALLATSINKKNTRLLRLFSVITIPSFLFTLWLVYLQLFVLHAVCLYCMISASTSTLLLFFGIYFLLQKKDT